MNRYLVSRLYTAEVLRRSVMPYRYYVYLEDSEVEELKNYLLGKP